jgi:hypothetical protein
MSMRYLGGFITNSPVQPTSTVAKGSWTLQQQLQAIAASNWPLPPPSDPNFEYVTMLLNGDGTNGAQNNTFLDSSTNNFSITRNGNTTQGSFSPYGSNWSNYLPTTFLSVANNAAFDFGSGDFTIECWVNPATTSQYNVCTRDASAADGYILSTNNFLADISSVWSINISFSSTPAANVWSHLAVVRSGSVFTVYLNGVSVGTQTEAGSISAGTQTFQIGSRSGQTNFTGYISNFRVVKGTAVYTTTFTPPTVPLTAITNTTLLTSQSNRFIDNSTNNFTITPSGSTSVQRFSPFNPTAPYSTSVIGGSGFFDGTGDYLTPPNNSNLAPGTSDFNFSTWIYPRAWTSYSAITDGSPSSMQIYGDGSGIQLSCANVAGVVNTGSLPPLNAWTYLTVSRVSGTTRIFFNSVQAASAGDGNNYGGLPYNIGGGSGTFNGYMTDTRFIKGSGVTSVTVPTAPVTAITNTQLLLSYTNAGIPDLAMQNNLETVGNAQVVTSVKKYGTGSLAFDGNGDFLSYPSSVFGGGNFTVECWVYFNSVSSDRTIFGINWNSNANSLSAVRVDTSSGVFRFMGSTDGTNFYFFQATSFAPVISTWYHIALVRVSGTVTLYVNGTSVGSVSSVPNPLFAGTGGSRIGNLFYSVFDNFLNGYVDDYRVTNGIARYTANFTPPTAALPTF